MIAPLVSMNGVTFAWNGTRALHDLSVSVNPGSTLMVTGPAGCGKSTCLRLLATLETGFLGDIGLGGNALRDFTAEQLKSWRTKVGVMLSPLGLFDWLTVYDGLEFVWREAEGRVNDQKDSHQSRIEQVLASVGLSDAGHRFPRELSGGMQKRLALARALLRSPELLILDEPASGLDPVTGRAIWDLISSLKRQTTVIIATSDVASIFRTADNVLLINRGAPLFYGTVGSFRDSADPSVQQFIRGRVEGPIA